MYRSTSSWHLVALLLGLTLIVSGCSSFTGMAETNAEATISPTISPLFQASTGVTPLPFEPKPTPEAMPARAGVRLQEGGSERRLVEVPIYDEQLLPNWTLASSQAMNVDDQYVGFAENGSVSILAMPMQGASLLRFSVTPETSILYERDKIMAVSFQLSGGTSSVAPEDLAVAVLGSNDHPYWVAGDTSAQANGRVTNNESPLFSETRLYYLGFNRTIPATTWVEVVVWLEDLIYDPDYDYVTGFYIKNDESYQQPFYIDRVSLLVSP
jgi:hypothetical protein